MKRYTLIILLIIAIVLMLNGCSIPESDNMSDALDSVSSTDLPSDTNDYVQVLEENGWQYHFIGEGYETGKPRWFSKYVGDTMYSINIDARDCYLYSDNPDPSSEWEKLFLSDKGEIYIFATVLTNDYLITIYWYPAYNQSLIYFDLEYTDSNFIEYHYVASYDIDSEVLNELINEHKDFSSVISDDPVIETTEAFYSNINILLSDMDMTVDDLLEESIE
ncbi:MAG: hypothetical protein PHO15_09515 [Eubacteriales bacterium]|nr:hypothetical protein [Eubacteriales bacterium]